MELDEVAIGRVGKGRGLRWIVKKLSTIQQQAEGSLVGEAVISGLVAVILIIGVVWNMPDAEIKRKIAPVVTPIALGTGLDQYWGMFSPNPPRRLETLEVHVTMSDGADRVWTFQRGERVIGVFSWYRWQKLTENAAWQQLDSRPGLAHWLARELAGPSERAVHVRMVLHTEMLPAPGSNGPRDANSETVYEEDLGSGQ
jgi:hypothetical protein